MPAIMQDYNKDATLELKQSRPDDQWEEEATEEEAVEVLPLRSPHLI